MFTAQIEITAQNCADLMTTALEGYTPMWCGSYTTNLCVDSRVKDEATWQKKIPFEMTVVDAETDEETTVSITRERIEKAFTALFKKPRFTSLENADAEDADYWFQHLIFGDCIFG